MDTNHRFENIGVNVPDLCDAMVGTPAVRCSKRRDEHLPKRRKVYYCDKCASIMFTIDMIVPEGEGGRVFTLITRCLHCKYEEDIQVNWTRE